MPDPCPPCKIILNGSFIATLANLLAKNTGRADIRTAAEMLTVAAQTQMDMLAPFGLATVSVDDLGDWNGCEQAQQLVKWLDADETETAAKSQIALMNEWTVTIWSTIADLAAGKLPT